MVEALKKNAKNDSEITLNKYNDGEIWKEKFLKN